MCHVVVGYHNLELGPAALLAVVAFSCIVSLHDLRRLWDHNQTCLDKGKDALQQKY